jgi:YgiT-type zinc finger domain-containing protein
MKHVNCECGGKTKTVRVPAKHYRAGTTFQFEDVEAEQCPGCGEIYFSAKTLRELDRKVDETREAVAK